MMKLSRDESLLTTRNSIFPSLSSKTAGYNQHIKIQVSRMVQAKTDSSLNHDRPSPRMEQASLSLHLFLPNN